MTIQRQYSLPNCRLVLEGWGEETSTSSGFLGDRPKMTILVNAECHFSGHEKPIAGGREFLDHLVSSVNQYAQQLLSGIPHLLPHKKGTFPLVSLQKTDNSLHQLTVRQTRSDEKDSSTPSDDRPLDENIITLSTVQLFDLVEAIDQMVADAQTLPDIFLDLTPIPKRKVAPQEPVSQRVVPAAVGVSSLAIAAVALFYVPTPEFKPTDSDSPGTEETIDSAPSNSSIPGTDPEASTEGDGSESSNNDSNSTVEPSNAVPSSNNAVIEETQPRRTSASDLNDLPSQDEIDELLTSAIPISDAEEMDELTEQLRSQIAGAWDEPPEFEEDLEYRVGVADDGSIVGFKFVNDAALNHLDEVPLLELTYIPIDPDALVEEPIGQFKVVFRPSGIVEVSPWYGRPQE